MKLTGKPDRDISILLQEAGNPNVSLDERYGFVIRAMEINRLPGIGPAHVAGNRKKALKIYERMANGGHVDSMCQCVTFYANGWHGETGAQPDNAKAREWCDRAVAAGSEWARNKALPVLAEIVAQERKASFKP